jgi:hypothetical protein
MVNWILGLNQVLSLRLEHIIWNVLFFGFGTGSDSSGLALLLSRWLFSTFLKGK